VSAYSVFDISNNIITETDWFASAFYFQFFLLAFVQMMSISSYTFLPSYYSDDSHFGPLATGVDIDSSHSCESFLDRFDTAYCFFSSIFLFNSVTKYDYGFMRDVAVGGSGKLYDYNKITM
jgi:hypothetical protein